METMNKELHSSNELQDSNNELRLRADDLDQTNAFLESILTSVDVGMIAIERKFQITMWNEHVTNLWGLRTEDVLGQSLLELERSVGGAAQKTGRAIPGLSGRG
jgi:two-component system CheB/CheR fusion protein